MLGCSPLLRQLPGLSFFFPAFDEEETVRPTVEAALQETLGRDVGFFAYPYGSFDAIDRQVR